MNRSLEIIKEIYKPYRYTIKGKTHILYTTSGNIVIKEENKHIRDLFNYLDSRGFNNYPKLIDDSRDKVNIYEYIEDTTYPKEQRALDLITTVANLHYKTTYYKDVTEDSYKEVYDNINNNIQYLNENYDNMFNLFFKNIYMSPKEQLFMRNYSKLKSNTNYCESKLNDWYSKVKDNNKIRVCTIHNNLELNHFIKNKQDYLISWDNYITDTPIIDLVNLYHKEYFDINFEPVIKKYESIYKLTDEEKELLFILIAIPPNIELTNNEIESCRNISKILDYVYKTEELIRPYNSKEQVK